jgi:hypothetical protein
VVLWRKKTGKLVKLILMKSLLSFRAEITGNKALFITLWIIFYLLGTIGVAIISL